MLFFQPCFRLLLTLMPSQPCSWSRELMWLWALCRGICCTKPDVRHPILLLELGFHSPGQSPRESQTFLSFASCSKENLRKHKPFSHGNPWDVLQESLISSKPLTPSTTHFASVPPENSTPNLSSLKAFTQKMTLDVNRKSKTFHTTLYQAVPFVPGDPWLGHR